MTARPKCIWNLLICIVRTSRGERPYRRYNLAAMKLYNQKGVPLHKACSTLFLISPIQMIWLMCMRWHGHGHEVTGSSDDEMIMIVRYRLRRLRRAKILIISSYITFACTQCTHVSINCTAPGDPIILSTVPPVRTSGYYLEYRLLNKKNPTHL